jgi:hypothetical protein
MTKIINRLLAIARKYEQVFATYRIVRKKAFHVVEVLNCAKFSTSPEYLKETLRDVVSAIDSIVGGNFVLNYPMPTADEFRAMSQSEIEQRANDLEREIKRVNEHHSQFIQTLLYERDLMLSVMNCDSLEVLSTTTNSSLNSIYDALN